MKFVSIFLLISVNVRHSVGKYQIPNVYQIPPVDNFYFLDSGLTICPGYRITQTGVITEWKIVAVNRYVLGLNLAVFRLRYPPENYQFDVVGTSQVPILRKQKRKKPQWMTVKLDKPISVNESDLLGFYYDKYKTRYELLSLGIHRPLNNTGNSAIMPCLVDLLDREDVRGVSPFYPLNMNKAVADVRMPGLVAVVTTGSTTTTTTGAPSGERETWDDDVHGAVKRARSSGRNRKNRIDIQIKEVPLDLYEVTSPTPQACLNTPTALRSCKWVRMRVFFDYTTGKCLIFYGCPPKNSGEENNFSSLAQCQLTCLPNEYK